MLQKGQIDNQCSAGVSRFVKEEDKLVFARVRAREACKFILNHQNYLDNIYKTLCDHKTQSVVTQTPVESLFNKVKTGLLNLSNAFCNSTPFKSVNVKDGVYKLSIPILADLPKNYISNICKLVESLLLEGLRKKQPNFKDLTFTLQLDDKKKCIKVCFSLNH